MEEYLSLNGQSLHEWRVNLAYNVLSISFLAHFIFSKLFSTERLPFQNACVYMVIMIKASYSKQTWRGDSLRRNIPLNEINGRSLGLHWSCIINGLLETQRLFKRWKQNKAKQKTSRAVFLFSKPCLNRFIYSKVESHRHTCTHKEGRREREREIERDRKTEMLHPYSTLQVVGSARARPGRSQDKDLHLDFTRERQPQACGQPFTASPGPLGRRWMLTWLSLKGIFFHFLKN